MHLAAESHVDRSIDGPGEFIQTNIVGTFTLLQEALRYWRSARPSARESFRFLHISTDEVFGSLGAEGLFTEDDGLRAELALLGHQGVVRSSGARLARDLRPADARDELLEQLRPVPFPRKADPAHDHQGARTGSPAGLWRRPERPRLALCRGSRAGAALVLERGRVGETYNIGGRNERTNLDVVETICDLLDELRPCTRRARAAADPFVTDRPGHDRRYAIDASKIERELGWRAEETSRAGSKRRCAGISISRLVVIDPRTGLHRETGRVGRLGCNPRSCTHRNLSLCRCTTAGSCAQALTISATLSSKIPHPAFLRTVTSRLSRVNLSLTINLCTARSTLLPFAPDRQLLKGINSLIGYRFFD